MPKTFEYFFRYIFIKSEVIWPNWIIDDMPLYCKEYNNCANLNIDLFLGTKEVILINIETIRNNPEKVKADLARRSDKSPIDDILLMDSNKRGLIHKADTLRAKRNQISKELSVLKNKPPQIIEDMRNVGNEIKNIEFEVKDIEANLNELLLNIPNLPEESVPYGLDESENNVIKTAGNPKTYEFATKPHWELGADLGIIDFKSGVNLSGSRFYVLKGKGATLQRALIQWMLNYHITEHGYTEVYLPNLVKKNTAINSGQLPKFSDNMYRDEEDDLWLVPTAEVPLTSLHQDETIDAETLPIKYLAHTPCFRREKASAGRDTRGIKRVHQFEKVEMYKLCPPEQSDAELKSLVENAESICKALNFHYRIIELCTGDLGFAAQKTYDLEVWSPGSKEWLEVSSCSNCGDFQARRTNIKYKTDKKDKPKFLNTLNGSGLAIPRVLIAILEQNQQSDGTINIPEPLRKYTGFDQIP